MQTIKKYRVISLAPRNLSLNLTQ